MVRNDGVSTIGPMHLPAEVKKQYKDALKKLGIKTIEADLMGHVNEVIAKASGIVPVVNADVAAEPAAEPAGG